MLGANLYLIRSVEGGTLIIASCIPVLQPLLRIIMRREPLATSGTPGQGASNRNGPAGASGDGGDGRKGPAFMLYPVDKKVANDTKHTNHGSIGTSVDYASTEDNVSQREMV